MSDVEKGKRAIQAMLDMIGEHGATDHAMAKVFCDAEMEIRAALSALGGWQPIETAPRDGTRVLAWHGEWEAPHTAQWYGSYWAVHYKTGPFLHQPTHWRPLPTPPAKWE